MTLDLDALEKVAQEAKSRNDRSFGFDDFGDLLIGAGAVLALIEDVKGLRKDNDEIHERMSHFLCEVTGGLLSYSTYPAETMIRETEAHFNEQAVELHAEEGCERAEAAEAERYALQAKLDRVTALHQPFTHPQYPGDKVYCEGCAVAGRGEKLWPCPTIQSIGETGE